MSLPNSERVFLTCGGLLATALRALLLALLATAPGSSALCAQSPENLPEYHGDHTQKGEIRNYGIEGLVDVLRLWEAGFIKQQRAVVFADTMGSPAAGIGGLYTGVADIAVMGREIWPIETEAFHRVFGYDPLAIVVATGSYDVQGKGFSMAIFVNRQNPISGLTLKQLDGIFGEERTGGWRGSGWSKSGARSADGNIRTWGQLGLTGEWADKPIHIYANDLTLNFGSFSIQQKVFQGGDKWNPALNEFPLSEPGAGGPPPARRGGDAISDALAGDPYGIGITGMQYGRKSPQVKALALATREGGPYVEPTKENFINRTYPLVESAWVYINRPPGRPVDSRVREFLRYVLSRQGQQDVAQEGSFLPLPGDVVRSQLEKLN